MTDMQENYSSFEQVLNKTGSLVYKNVGVSMLPLIRENRDIMVIEKLTGTPKKYDAVLFRRKGVKGRGKYVLHRILKILPDNKYFIAGDNCTSGEIVEAEQILGVLKTVFRDEKAVDFGGPKYKAYLYLWCVPYHFRFAVLAVRRSLIYLLSGIKHKLSGK